MLSAPYSNNNNNNNNDNKYVKVRGTGEFGGLAPTHSHLGARRRWAETNTLPIALPPGKRLVIYCTGGWMGTRTGLDIMENFAPTGIRSPAVQPVASRYTEYAVSATFLMDMGI